MCGIYTCDGELFRSRRMQKVLKRIPMDLNCSTHSAPREVVPKPRGDRGDTGSAGERSQLGSDRTSCPFPGARSSVFCMAIVRLSYSDSFCRLGRSFCSCSCLSPASVR